MKYLIEYLQAKLYVELKEKQTVFKTHCATLTLENIVVLSTGNQPVVMSVGDRTPLKSSHQVVLIDYTDLRESAFVLGSFYKFAYNKVTSKNVFLAFVRPFVIIKKPKFPMSESDLKIVEVSFTKAGARKVVWE